MAEERIGGILKLRESCNNLIERGWGPGFTSGNASDGNL